LSKYSANATLYYETERWGARISEAVSESLYLEESLEAIVKTTMDSLNASGAALVLEDGNIAWPEGVANEHAIRQPLRWRGRTIGELVAEVVSLAKEDGHLAHRRGNFIWRSARNADPVDVAESHRGRSVGLLNRVRCGVKRDRCAGVQIVQSIDAV